MVLSFAPSLFKSLLSLWEKAVTRGSKFTSVRCKLKAPWQNLGYCPIVLLKVQQGTVFYF